MLVVDFVGVAADAPGCSYVIVDRDGVGVVIVMAGICVWFAKVSTVVDDMINLGFLVVVVHHGGQTRGHFWFEFCFEFPAFLSHHVILTDAFPGPYPATAHIFTEKIHCSDVKSTTIIA